MKVTRRALLSWLLGGSSFALLLDVFYNVGRYLIPPAEVIGGGAAGKQAVIPISELPAESSKVVRVGGKLVVVVRQGNEIHALSAVCTHLGCIVQAKEKGGPGVLYCPCHEAFFDVKTGKVLGGPAPRPLEVYPVKQTQDQIIIGEA